MIKKQYIRNLIIILIVIMLGIGLIQMPVYAADETVTDIINKNVAGIYYIIRIICIVVLFIVALGGFAYMFIAKTGEAMALFKRIALYVIVGLVAVVFLTYIISAFFAINDLFIDACKTLALKISGIEPSADTDAFGELSLYDSAISKAYEYNATSGFLGTIMYAALIFFTVRFFIIYLKRYINIIILIVVSPVVIVRHSMLRAFRGTKGKVGLWTKEMIYNIYIQSLHALFYSVCMALTVSLSGDLLNYIGMILTILVFAAMSSIEGIVRRLFNFVGGSSSVRTFESSKLKEKVNEKISKGSEALANGTVGLDEKDKKLPENAKNSAIKFKDKVKEAPGKIKDNVKKIPGNVKESANKFKDTVSESAIKAKDKVVTTVKEAPGKIKTGIKKQAKKARKKIKDYSYKQIKKIKKHIMQTNTVQNLQAVVTIGRYCKNHIKRKKVIKKADNGTASNEELALASQFNDLDDEAEELTNMENAVKGSDDLVATLYKLKGPSPFILSAGVSGGSPYLGMTMIQSSMDIEKLFNGDLEGAGFKNYKRTITLRAPNNKAVNEIEMVEDKDNENNKHKKYTFKEFSPGAVKTITSQALLQTALSDGTVFSLIKVNAKMNETGVVPVGNATNEERRNQTRSTSNVSQTVHYSSRTTREDLIRLRDHRDQTIDLLRQRVNDNNWAYYVSSNNNVRRLVGNVNERQNETNQRQQAEDNFNKVYSGVVVLTAMEHNIALENVDIRNDKNLQKEMIDNLSMFNICQEEEKMNEEQKENAIRNLESKIYSLTTDDKTTYYDMVVEFDKMAKEQDITFGDNIENESNGNTEGTSNEEKVSFKDKIKDKMVDFVGNVTGTELKDENGKIKSVREVYEEKIDEHFDPEGYLNTIIKAATEMMAAEAKNDLLNTKDDVKEFLDEVLIDDAKEFKNSVEENYRIDDVGGRIKNKAKTTAESVANTVLHPGSRSSGKGENSSSNENKDKFIIFVYGEVIHPGKILLKELPKGQYYTIETAIKAAGGVTEKADLTKVNLNAKLERGMIVRVPKIYDDNDEEDDDDNSISEDILELIVNKAIASYIVEENIKDYSLLRLVEHQRRIVKLVHKELDNMNKEADEYIIRELIEKRIKELELANKKVFNLTTEEQKEQAKKYQNAQKQKAAMNRIEEEQKLEKEKEKQEALERESREALEDALKDLEDEKAYLIGVDSKNARVNKARSRYMDTDVLSHAK